MLLNNSKRRRYEAAAKKHVNAFSQSILNKGFAHTDRRGVNYHALMLKTVRHGEHTVPRITLVKEISHV